jgi:hypothetical protein
MNDTAFRFFGAAVGASLLAALWFHARVFGNRYPVVSLALVGLSPSVIRWGDSIRAYGLGMTLIVLTSALTWRFLDKPSLGRFFGAAVVAVLSVQTLYYDSVLLLAICVAGLVVSISRRQARSATMVVGIGVVAALSLLPYIVVITRASEWNALVRIQEYTIGWYRLRLFDALRPAGFWGFIVWSILLLVAAFTGVDALRLQRRWISVEREQVIFGFVLLIVGVAGSYVFLWTLRYYTQPWYYLTSILIAGLGAEIILGVFPIGKIRSGISLIAFTAGVTAWIRAPTVVATRMTNADQVSAILREETAPDDLIVVDPWYDGVSFARYYVGPAPWMTVPPIQFHRFHRYDLLAQLTHATDSVDALAPLLAAMEGTLRSGHTVFVVGTFPKANTQPMAAAETSRSPDAPTAADHAGQEQMSLYIGNTLRTHSTNLTSIPVPSRTPISTFEAMTITAVRGWH